MLWIFYANQTSLCLDPQQNQGCDILSLPGIFADRSKAMLLLCILCVIYITCLSLLRCLVRSLKPCYHMLVLLCFVTFPYVVPG